MNFEIKTYIGLGDIQFGNTRQDNRNIIKGNVEEFIKFKGKPPIDIYKKHGIYLFYKEDGFCEAIEIYKPGKVFFNNVNLLEMTFEGVTEFLKNFDSNLYAESDGFTSVKLGIGGYCPNPDKSALIESIICFEKGYYGTLYK